MNNCMYFVDHMVLVWVYCCSWMIDLLIYVDGLVGLSMDNYMQPFVSNYVFNLFHYPWLIIYMVSIIMMFMSDYLPCICRCFFRVIHGSLYTTICTLIPYLMCFMLHRIKPAMDGTKHTVIEDLEGHRVQICLLHFPQLGGVNTVLHHPLFRACRNDLPSNLYTVW